MCLCKILCESISFAFLDFTELVLRVVIRGEVVLCCVWICSTNSDFVQRTIICFDFSFTHPPVAFKG